jgi:carboxyl-terminal processing protease
VNISVVRRARTEPQEVEIMREELAPPRLIVEKTEADIAYLRVPALNSGKAAEIRQKLIQFDHQGLRKLILDLRDCALGETSEGIATAQLFLSSGKIGSLRSQSLPTREFVADPARLVWKHPLTVLISGGTAGSAEVLAASIAGNQRGDVVGERTFGAASEQKLFPLEDGAALVLTVANYYTPAGKSIPDEGVIPTVEVSAASDDLPDFTDEDLPLKPESEQTPSRQDRALKKAIKLLKSQTSQRRAA